jgi:hypothetical protein
METPTYVCSWKKRVFLDWVKRLNLCIEINGGHTEQDLQIKAFVLPFLFFPMMLDLWDTL